MLKSASILAYLGVAMLMLSAGCAVGPDYDGVAPREGESLAWRGETMRAYSGSDTVTAETEWWQRFDDDELDRLVTEAMAGNFQLAQAAARVQTAYAQRGIANSERLPTLGAEAAYTLAGAGTRSASLNGPPPGQDVKLFGAGAIAGWEVDLWGRVQRLVESADADIGAAQDAYRDVAVAIAAETALAYIDIKTLDERLAALDRNIELQEQTLSLTEQRYENGEGRLVDVEESRRLLERTAAARPQLEQARRSAENRLAVLLGKLPQDGLLHDDSQEPRLPKVDELGLPAELLVRRPDVREAERQYASSVALIGAAEAERFPRLTIAGSFTLQADDVGNYFNPESFVYSFGPTLQVPVFEGGRIESNIAVRKSQADAARWQLEQTLIEAVREVEDAASGVLKAQARAARLASAQQAAERSVELQQERYDSGLSDLFELTDSQRQLVEIQDEVLVARQQTFINTVNLYRALGGGWAALDHYRPVDSEPVNANLSLIEPKTHHED